MGTIADLFLTRNFLLARESALDKILEAPTAADNH